MYVFSVINCKISSRVNPILAAVFSICPISSRCKKCLKTNLKTTDNELKKNKEEEIGKENKIIKIWIKNIEKINRQLTKLQR